MVHDASEVHDRLRSNRARSGGQIPAAEAGGGPRLGWILNRKAGQASDMPESSNQALGSLNYPQFL